MKILSFTIAMLFSLLLQAQTTVDDYRRKAIELYPDIAVKDSALNSLYVTGYNERRILDPDFFKDPQWPLTLAKVSANLLPASEASNDKTQQASTTKIDAAAGFKVGINLAPGWDGVQQGGSATMRDLAILFSSVAKASGDTTAGRDIKICENVTYLMPLADAMLALGIHGRLSSKTLIACPGFPLNSLYYYAFDGAFEGQYNRLYLVADKADLVVCVQLVAEKPAQDSNGNYRADWHTYNFVNTRTKALARLNISHTVSGYRGGHWQRLGQERNYDGGYQGSTQFISTSFRVDSGLRNERKCLERVRWYVPKPLVELILHCVEKSMAK